jgi:hypothetical protein
MVQQALRAAAMATAFVFARDTVLAGWWLGIWHARSYSPTMIFARVASPLHRLVTDQRLRQRDIAGWEHPSGNLVPGADGDRPVDDLGVNELREAP